MPQWYSDLCMLPFPPFSLLESFSSDIVVPASFLDGGEVSHRNQSSVNAEVLHERDEAGGACNVFPCVVMAEAQTLEV